MNLQDRFCRQCLSFHAGDDFCAEPTEEEIAELEAEAAEEDQDYRDAEDGSCLSAVADYYAGQVGRP
jgi:hypothetical protein